MRESKISPTPFRKLLSHSISHWTDDRIRNILEAVKNSHANGVTKKDILRAWNCSPTMYDKFRKRVELK